MVALLKMTKKLYLLGEQQGSVASQTLAEIVISFLVMTCLQSQLFNLMENKMLFYKIILSADSAPSGTNSSAFKLEQIPSNLNKHWGI